MQNLDQNNIKNTNIRRQWDEETSTWYFSIVDTISVITNSSDPRNYWKVLKNRLKNSYPELVTACNQLKMKSSDGKFYLTDAMDADNILKLVNNISPSESIIFNSWLQNFKIKNAFDTIETTKNEEIFYKNPDKTNDDIWNKTDEEDQLPLPIDGHLPVDIFKKNNQIIINADISGTIIDDIFVSITCKNITIKGTRNKKDFKEDIKIIVSELKWGTFVRTLSLPYEIDIDKFEASEKNGMLTLRLNIIDKQKNKIVKIKSLG
jgi:HSP20 family molecular chaperone IbpA